MLQILEPASLRGSMKAPHKVFSRRSHSAERRDLAYNSKRGDARVHDRQKVFRRNNNRRANREEFLAEDRRQRSSTILERISQRPERGTRSSQSAEHVVVNYLPVELWDLPGTNDHAVTSGRDEHLRYGGGHSPEHHTVALEVAEAYRGSVFCHTAARE